MTDLHRIALLWQQMPRAERIAAILFWPCAYVLAVGIACF